MSDCFWLFVMFLRQVTACEVEHCWYVMKCVTVPDGFGYRLSRSMVCVLLPYRRSGVYCKIRVLLLRYCWYGRLAFNTTVFPATCFCVDACDSCNPCEATCCIACACFLRIPLFLCPNWIAPTAWAFCAPSLFPFWAKKIHRFDALGMRFAHHLPARRGVKTMEVDLPLPACRTISHIYPFTSLFGERDFLYHGLLFKQQHQIMRVEAHIRTRNDKVIMIILILILILILIASSSSSSSPSSSSSFHQRHHHHRHQQHTRTCQNMSKHTESYKPFENTTATTTTTTTATTNKNKNKQKNKRTNNNINTNANTNINMGGSYLKYSWYTPEVLEYFFWNIFFGMFWNIFGKGYLIPPPRTIPWIFLALSSPYTWNIFEYIFSDCLTYLGMKYHVVCRKLQYLHRNPSRSRQPDMTAWFC